MAFYYEAEAPVWKYKERYGDWKRFPKRTSQTLEKLYKKIQAGDSSTIEHTWKSDENNSYKINLQNMTAHNLHSYYRNSDVSREGYPYPTPGNQNKLRKIHQNYMHEVIEYEEPVQRFNLVDFLSDCNINPSGIESLIVLAMCETESFVDIPEDKFAGGLAKCGCSNLGDISRAIEPIKRALINQKKVKVLKSFARWLFVAVKEDSARTIATADLAPILGIVCPVQQFPLSPDFAAFLQMEADKEDGDRKTLSRDDWVMIVEFVTQKPSWAGFEDYLEDEGWPLVVSDCWEFSNKGGEN